MSSKIELLRLALSMYDTFLVEIIKPEGKFVVIRTLKQLKAINDFNGKNPNKLVLYHTIWEDLWSQ